MTYIADWKYDDVVYHIVGKLELKELKKIIKEMKFQSDIFKFLTYIVM